MLDVRRRRGAAAFRRQDADPGGKHIVGTGRFPASHAFSLGMMGMHGEAHSNLAIQNSDLILAFGMRFDDRVTGNLKTYAPERRKSILKSTLPKSIRMCRRMCRWSVI